jgi:hypothetical protein
MTILVERKETKKHTEAICRITITGLVLSKPLAS